LAKNRKPTSSRATAPKRREGDYVGIAIDYANEVLADKKREHHGLLIQQAAKRFLADLKRAKTKRAPFIFDEWQANDPCDFIEKLPHIEGVWETPTIQLHRSHVFFVVQLFGFRNHDGTRRFTSALFAVARKNAKSTLAAAILLYCFCCEDEPGAQVITAATTYSQAAIILKLAQAMVQKTPDLRDYFGLGVWAKAISRMEISGSFKALHAKASTQDGLNPSHVGLDEIHAHKTPDLLNVLQSAAGARRAALFLFTTTEGYLNPGPWEDLRKFAKDLLKGVFGQEADHFLAVFFAVDDKDEDHDEKAWRKANPLHDANPNLIPAIRKEWVEAKRMPSKLSEFRIKRLNRPASTASGWIDLTKWRRCGGKVDLDWLAGHPCWGGLDLSSTMDITAFRLVWLVDGVYYTYGWRWVPEDQVKVRTERATVPYASWVEQGLLKQTPGDVVDYAVVEADIVAAWERFQPLAIGYDSWNAADLVNRLVTQGLPMVQFIQGTKSYQPAMQAVEIAYVGGKLVHGGDPLLTWNASNVVARKDSNNNQAPDKKRSPDKIDDMVALFMAIGVSLGPAEEPDVHEQAFVVID